MVIRPRLVILSKWTKNNNNIILIVPTTETGESFEVKRRRERKKMWKRAGEREKHTHIHMHTHTQRCLVLQKAEGRRGKRTLRREVALEP